MHVSFIGSVTIFFQLMRTTTANSADVCVLSKIGVYFDG
jgi:hypothetical protein